VASITTSVAARRRRDGRAVLTLALIATTIWLIFLPVELAASISTIHLT
jgi:hypothetical protein